MEDLLSDKCITVPDKALLAIMLKEKYGIRAVRPLAPKTLNRIARGLKKFVIDNPDPFVVDMDTGLSEPYLMQIGQTGFAADRSKDVRELLTTIVSKNEHCQIEPVLAPCIMCNNENNIGASVDSPLPTITSGNRNFLVAPALIQMNNHCDGRDIKDPLPTITAGDGHFGEVRAFLIKYYGNGIGQDMKEPLDTVTAQDRFGLVTIVGVDYQIADIGLRMLEPRELYGCNGAPDDYIIDHDCDGNPISRREAVRRCGNMVCPPVAAALVRANLPELCVARRMRNMRIAEEKTGQPR